MQLLGSALSSFECWTEQKRFSFFCFSAAPFTLGEQVPEIPDLPIGINTLPAAGGDVLLLCRQRAPRYYWFGDAPRTIANASRRSLSLIIQVFEGIYSNLDARLVKVST